MSDQQQERSQVTSSLSSANKGLQPIETATRSKSISIFVHPITRMHKIPVFKGLWLYLMLMAIYDVFVRWLFGLGFSQQFFKETSNVAYLSAAFGLLLVLRTNTAYERWWEGRKLWGQLVNESRNLCLKVQAYVNVSPEEKERISEQIVSFAFSLKSHLRNSRATKDLPGIQPIALIPPNYHLPSQVALSIFETMGRWREQNLISDSMVLVLDPHLRAFMDIAGACERIKSTPLPVSYRAFLRQGIALNLFLLPWCVNPQLNIWLSAPLVLVASYFLIGLELIAEAIEDPFGVDGDDLLLDQICAGIQKVITEISTTHCLSGKAESGASFAPQNQKNAIDDFDPAHTGNSLKALPIPSKAGKSSELPHDWLPVDPLKYTGKMKTLPFDPLKD